MADPSEARIAAARAMQSAPGKPNWQTWEEYFLGLADVAFAAADVVQASEAEQLRTVLTMFDQMVVDATAVGCRTKYVALPDGADSCLHNMQSALDNPTRFTPEFGDEVRSGGRLCDVCSLTLRLIAARAVLAGSESPTSPARETEQLRTVLSMLVEAADYTGDDGGRWDDALSFARAVLAGSESPTPPDATKANAIYVGLVTCALDSTPHVAGSDCQYPVPAVVDAEQKDATT